VRDLLLWAGLATPPGRPARHGEFLNLLADWEPDPEVRRMIFVDSPDELFFGSS
jgi:hypothetical protein